MMEAGAGGRGGAGGGATLSKFDLKTRKLEKLADGVGVVRPLGERRKDAPPHGRRRAVDEEAAVAQERLRVRNTPSSRPRRRSSLARASCSTTDMEVSVDPIAEWKQMYHEVWRIERSYFYDPNLHGVNVADAEKEYEKYLDSLGSRADLNYIIHDMISEMTVGHLRGGGGNIPQAKAIPGGLLGADYEIANGHYRFKKIYTGESWNPQMQAPLAAPGLNVTAGDYLLSVDGQELTAHDDVSRLLENTAGKRVTLRISADASGANAREVTVIPVSHGNAASQPGLDRIQPPQSRRAERRQAGLCLSARYLHRRTD